MKKLFMPAVFLLALLFTSCEETPEPHGPCEDDQWATATLNGEEHCMGKAEVTYWNANTNSAIINLITKQADAIDAEIHVDFSIPVEGVALNTPYPVKSGKVFDADVITEGSITLLVFDPPSVNKAGCIAGTFNLKAENGGITTFNYTNGRFVYFKGQGTESSISTGCNPF